MNQPVEPFRIEANLFYVGASDVTSFLITTRAGHILIDGGFEETAPIIIRNLHTLGFRIEDVRILLASHAHFDHAGGLQALKKASGAAFVASRADAPLFARGDHQDPQFGDRLPFPPIVPDRLVDDGDSLALGGVELVARITPGHTPGCTTWTMKSGTHSVVFVCSASVPREYKLSANRLYPNAVADYRKTFSVLRSLRPDIFLGSHGSFFDLDEKRKTGNFVDREGYARFVDASERAFEARVAAEVR
jgi:metallo-beta-lactamase class B